MLVLITYDVNTGVLKEGRTRLRKVAKECVNYGQRVQNSVFECIVDQAIWQIKELLIHIIDEETDSLRFYYLGDNYHNKIEHFGYKPSMDMEGPLLI